MEKYETELGYTVQETIEGLDVYENGEIVCVLHGKTLDDYRYDGEIDDDHLESAIKEEIDIDNTIRKLIE